MVNNLCGQGQSSWYSDVQTEQNAMSLRKSVSELAYGSIKML